MIALYLVIATLVGYLFGNISFSRIFSRLFAGKDITTEGSKSPGMTNVLRTLGFKEALLTLFCDAIKSGAPALGGYFLFEHFFEGYGYLAYTLIAFGAIVGHCFPVFYKFKGGKGAASTFGMFLFHPIFWWGALIDFAVGFVAALFYRIMSVINLSAILALNIYATVYYSIKLTDAAVLAPILTLIWLTYALVLFMHRSNIKRLVAGKENKINLVEKIKQMKKKKPIAEGNQEVVDPKVEERLEDDNK